MPSRPLIHAITAWWAAETLLLLLTSIAALWLALGVLQRVLALPALTITKRDLLAATSLAALAAALCFGYSLAMGLGWRTQWLIGTQDTDTAELHEYLSCVLLSGVILPSLIAAMWCGFVTRRRVQISQADEAPILWRERLRAVRFMPLMNGVALFLAVFGTAAWWMAVLLKSNDEIALSDLTSWLVGQPLPPIVVTPVHPLWPLGGLALSLLLWWARPIFNASAREKPLVAYRLRWLQATLGALCVLGSAAYFGALAWSVPLRAQADVEVNQLVQRGEVALMSQNVPVR